ncbi:MAG: hypothetical protein Kow0098_18130 [Ignavibacteriaceae bacterium]
MADLEENGFINHPHTSAGRIPTDKGYRFYVDSLIQIPKLHNSQKGKINKTLEQNQAETDEILKVATNLLSNITNQLACLTYPSLDSGHLEKIQIVSLSSSRILVVISIKSGLVKTITLEVKSEIKPQQIDSVQRLLNERLYGLTFREIRTTFKERFKDVTADQKPVIRLFLDSVGKIFVDFNQSDRLLISGAKNIIKQPEFEDPERFESVIELIENKNIIVHILEKTSGQKQDKVFISIGSENKNEKLQEYSFISKEYRFGDTSGTVGIIGPKRMEYSRIIAIVDYLAKMLSEYLTHA